MARFLHMQESCQSATLKCECESFSFAFAFAFGNPRASREGCRPVKRVKAFIFDICLTTPWPYAREYQRYGVWGLAVLYCILPIRGITMYKRVHIYDLDGVLVDSSHRYRTNANGDIDLDYWRANNNEKNIKKDCVLPFAKQYFNDCVDPTTYTIICTSRVWNWLDIQFIIGRLGAPNKLIMRPEYNVEPDAVLKCKQLKSLFNLKQFRHLKKVFWDDNMRTVYAIADLGIESNYVESSQGRITNV